MTDQRQGEAANFDATRTMGELDHHAGIKPVAVAMVASALVVGSILAYLVIVHPAVATIEERTTSLAVPAAFVSPRTTANAEDGRMIATLQCSGCHQTTGRLTGPSWKAIAARYGPAAPGQTFETCLPRLVTSVGHPEPGWDGYPAGPVMQLDLAQREALAAFILSVGLATQTGDKR